MGEVTSHKTGESGGHAAVPPLQTQQEKPSVTTLQYVPSKHSRCSVLLEELCCHGHTAVGSLGGGGGQAGGSGGRGGHGGAMGEGGGKGGDGAIGGGDGEIQSHEALRCPHRTNVLMPQSWLHR